MINKAIIAGSFDFDFPAMQLVPLHSRGIDREFFIKSAAVLTKEIDAVRPEQGKACIHLIATGDQETYGLNRNGDGFPKIANIERHHTFVTDAHAFKHHVNKDPNIASGVVKASAYNPNMCRTELLVLVDENKWSQSLDKLANDELAPVSMACTPNPDYPVLTVEGYKRIEDVRVGDMVLTHKGRWRKVTQVNRRVYSGELLEFRVNGMPLPLELTADHMMYAKCFSEEYAEASIKQVARRYFKDPAAFEAKRPDWHHVSHLKAGDRFFYVPTPRIPGRGAITDIDLAKLMGYYVAEGSLAYNKDRACTTQFTVNADDTALQTIPELIERRLPGVTCGIAMHKLSNVCMVINVSNTQLSEFMRSSIGNDVHKKTVPPEIFNAERDVKLAFLGAWLDGDGFTDDKGVHWSTCNQFLALQLRDLLATAGMPASIYMIDHSKCETSGYEGSGIEYTVNLSWLDVIQLLDWSSKLGEADMPARERRRPPSMRRCPDGTYAYRISQVKSRFDRDVQLYNIEVDEDESYTLAGLISHNCRVPYDECTACHNYAKTRADYCDCLRNHITKVAANGVHIGAINRYPTYFDISEVHRNADRIAFGLQKVASAVVMGGAELAEHLGLDIPHVLFESSSDSSAGQKLAALERLASMEKEIEGVIAGKADKKGIRRLLPATHTESVSEKDAEALHCADPRAVFGYLAKEGVCLPVEGFYRVIYGPEYDTVAAQVEKAAECLPGIFTKLSLCPEKSTEDGSYDANGGAVAPAVKDLVHKLARRMSMHEGPAVTRITVTAVRQKPTKLAAIAVKEASAEADFMASEYAKYQLSYVTGMENSGSDRILMLTALQNYVK